MVIPTTWYEKNMMSQDSMSNVKSNTNNQDVDDFEGCIMDDFDKHKFGEVYGLTLKVSIGTPKLGQGNSVPKLSQGSQKPNDPYTFVDKKKV